MASEKQIEANRKNAESAGVRSEEGKLRVRHNAFKHGMTSKTLLGGLKTIEEDLKVFEEILHGFEDSFCPRDQFEFSLVEQMAKASLKLRRFDHLESGLFEDNDFRSMEKSVLVITDQSYLESILKYKASVEAQFYRALMALNNHRQSKQLSLFSQSQEKCLENG